MTDNIPLITIGITNYNAEESIEKAIDSALSQDYPNIEIIIYDDCSTDSSVDVIQTRIEMEPCAKLVLGKINVGVAGARNEIIKNMKGDFIAFFDDDDASDPQRITKQYQRIISYESKQKTDLVCCWASGYKIYDNGYQVAFDAIGSQKEEPIGQDVINYQLFMDRNPKAFYGSGTPSCSMMVRKSVYDKIGCYDKELKRVEDSDFAIRLAEIGGHFIGCPERLVQQSATGGADKRPEVAYKSEVYLINKHKALFTSERCYHYALDWTKLRFFHFSQRKIKTFSWLIVLFLKYPYWTGSKFLKIVPQRYLHERKMNKK